MARLIESYEIRLAEPGCSIGTGRWGVVATLPDDISEVFPYLNTVIESARYDHANKVLIFTEAVQTYALESREIRVARVEGPEQARQVVSKLVERINKVWSERKSITPLFKERKPLPVMEVFKLLPRINCKKCSYPTCMAYAAALSRGAAKLEDCPPLASPEHAAGLKKLRALIAGER